MHSGTALSGATKFPHLPVAGSAGASGASCGWGRCSVTKFPHVCRVSHGNREHGTSSSHCQVTTKFPHVTATAPTGPGHPAADGTGLDHYQISSREPAAGIVAGRHSAGLPPDASFRDLFTPAAWPGSLRWAGMGRKVHFAPPLREWIW